MLDNELVRQKDHILSLVRDEKYEEARVLLKFSEELWAACGYDYKTKEIRRIITDELLAKRALIKHWKQHEKLDKLLKSC